MELATNLHRKAFDSCKLSVYIWLLGVLPLYPPGGPRAHPDFRAWLCHCIEIVIKAERNCYKEIFQLSPTALLQSFGQYLSVIFAVCIIGLLCMVLLTLFK